MSPNVSPAFVHLDLYDRLRSRTGAPWKDLPERYPSRSTCHRWLTRWAEDGTWERIRMALIEELGCANELELKEAFVDASYGFSGAVRSPIPSVSPRQLRPLPAVGHVIGV